VISVWSGLGRGGPVLARWTARQPAETSKPQPAAINALWWVTGKEHLTAGFGRFDMEVELPPAEDGSIEKEQ
jgi:hypothetical protein